MRAFLRKHRTLFSVVWLVFTLSLGVWWFVLALGHIEELSELSSRLEQPKNQGSLKRQNTQERLKNYARQRRMILLEGSVFLAMLAIGGVILIWFVHKDARRSHLIRDFFSTVTHEMKTPLASLQLQVENLVEEYEGHAVAEKLKSILKENARIERQMNKAFYLASLMRSEPLYLEKVSLSDLFRELSWDWPQVDFQNPKNLIAFTDRRALASILKNLFENSVQHGGASKIECKAELLQKNGKRSRLCVTVLDNGTGFAGDPKRLGRPFVRHTPSSGTGIGIYITKMLVKKMKGKVRFGNRPEGGFWVQIELPSVSG